MTISALITTYNRIGLVGRAIESVLNQSLAPDEIIVVDDGSKDGTADFVRTRYGQRLRLVQQPNEGISGSHRRAIKEAQADWVAFLDSDDEWPPERNRLFAAAANQVPEDVAWIFGDTEVVDDKGTVGTVFNQYGYNVSGPTHVLEDSLSIHLPFQLCLIPSSIIRRSALQTVRAYNEGLLHSEDYLLAIQLACRHRFAAIPEIVTRAYRTSDALSNSNDLRYRESPDYYRARIMGFSLAIESGRRPDWIPEYSHVVRGLCKLRASQGLPIRETARDQFRYGVSSKSAAFYTAALLGAPGVRLWDYAGAAYRRVAKSFGVDGNPSLPKLL